jgi:hypothetical protein
LELIHPAAPPATGIAGDQGAHHQRESGEDHIGVGMVEPILGHDDHHGADGQGKRESAQCDIVQREIRVYQLVDGEWAAEGQGKHDNPEKLGGIFAFAQFCPHLRSALEDFVHV